MPREVDFFRCVPVVNTCCRGLLVLVELLFPRDISILLCVDLHCDNNFGSTGGKACLLRFFGNAHKGIVITLHHGFHRPHTVRYTRSLDDFDRLVDNGIVVLFAHRHDLDSDVDLVVHDVGDACYGFLILLEDLDFVCVVWKSAGQVWNIHFNTLTP